MDSRSKWIGQPAVNEIDEYLSIMGFAPPAIASGGPDPFGSNADFDASFLTDWYQGNSSLIGLLEQDLMFSTEPEYGYMPCPSE